MSISLLATDGYKFSMAEAGYPLRRETFYFTHRGGGPQIVPFDARREITSMLPGAPAQDYAYLSEHDYSMGAGFRAAIVDSSRLQIDALPPGSWFLPREPVVSVTGPSALVSWLEPLLLQWNFRIQVATLGLLDPGRLAGELSVVTCEEERELVRQTLDSVGVEVPDMRVDAEGYAGRVEARVVELVGILGDASRLFEVGLRSASCLAQHRIALEGARRAGLRRTSHVLAARELGLTPVGTMGHEHVQRFGSDEEAFRAMRDRRPYRSSYLLDTFDTLRSGLPAALRVMAENPELADSVRYDSGDKEAQYRFAMREARRLGLRPIQILEDSFDFPQTRRFEALRREFGWREDEQFYGYGGFLIAQTAGRSLTRDRVSAVYKLSQSGPHPTMKFGDEPGSGKESIPGRPVVFRRLSGTGPLGLVGQKGEPAPEGYALLEEASGDLLCAARQPDPGPIQPSEATAQLIARCREAREALLGSLPALV